MNKYVIAVVGPCDSVALIDNVARDWTDKLKVLPIVYQDAGEVPDILKKRIYEADVWLFSGIAPYNYAINAGFSERPMLYIPHTGASLYRVLLQITYVERLNIDRISFDTFSMKEISDTFADIALPLPKVYQFIVNGVVATKDVTNFHYKLWKKGKIQVAVTCFLATYIELKKLGVPVFRIWPTRDNIRTMLDMALRAGESYQFKERQIAIQHIAIDDYDSLIEGSLSSYAAKRIELKLYEILVKYDEQVKGSIVSRGYGHYTIYSTRGSIEEYTDGFTVMPLLDDIAKELNIKVSGGIGFGQTAHAADENAHRALGLAQKAGKGKWMVVNDDHSVTGPLNSSMQLRYHIASEDRIFRETASKLGVSVMTLNRLLAAGEKIGSRTFKAEELALYLSITSRSARRLLNSMVNSRLAEVVGEEIIGKGRPAKLYRINLRACRF